MTLAQFIEENREEIDEAISRALGGIENQAIDKPEDLEKPDLPFQLRFAVEELPEELCDIDILNILMDLSTKIGFNSLYHKDAGICSIDLPFEACFVIFLELVQKLFKETETSKTE